jgi:hypothetical protein
VKKKRDLKYSFCTFYTVQAVVEGGINERIKEFIKIFIIPSF